jgi:hypothetical protein
MSSTYRYTSLDNSRRQIRLLHLHPLDVPDTEDIHGITAPDKIRCTFSLASLHDEPYYEALSYVWGTSGTTSSVLLHERSFPVTRNLESILRHLRGVKERVLWIDALCIDQSNIDERSQQVSEMHNIFARASQVVAYLGEAWEGIESALALMVFTGDHPELHWDSSSERSIRSHGFDGAKVSQCDSIVRFFSSPWWTRIWTVQEGVLAQRVEYAYGTYRLNADILHRFQHYCNLHRHWCCSVLTSIESTSSSSGLDFAEGYQRAVRPRQLADRTAKTLGFLEVTAMFRPRLCLNTSDKIYALLGIAPDLRACVAVDYTRSPRDVYKLVSIVSLGSDLMLWSHFYGDRDPNLGLLSWVLDFSTFIHEVDNAFYLNRLISIQRHFRTSLESTTSFTYLEPDKANMCAIILDVISTTSPTRKIQLLDGAGIREKRFIDACWQILNAHDPSRQHYASSSDAFRHTICGGVVGRVNRTKGLRWYRPILDKDSKGFEKWRALCKVNGVGDFTMAFRVVSMNRRFAVTDKGYIGWVPANAQKGDVVALFPGGNVPYVLRPVSQPDSAQNSMSSATRNRRYEFLGDAYIHGIMHGEAWNEADLEDVTLV